MKKYLVGTVAGVVIALLAIQWKEQRQALEAARKVNRIYEEQERRGRG